ncbi:hypothetical protein [Paludibaculum fermentans]
MQCAIHDPDKVQRAAIISSMIRRDGKIAEALEPVLKPKVENSKCLPAK